MNTFNMQSAISPTCYSPLGRLKPGDDAVAYYEHPPISINPRLSFKAYSTPMYRGDDPMYKYVCQKTDTIRIICHYEGEGMYRVSVETVAGEVLMGDERLHGNPDLAMQAAVELWKSFLQSL